MKNFKRVNHLFLGAMLICLTGTFNQFVYRALAAEEWPKNIDESKVPAYVLPDPLVMANGRRVKDAADWRENRRPEVLKLFERFEYGKTPGGRPADMTFEVRSVVKDALDGKAIRKEVRVHFTKDAAGPKMDLLLYLPADAKKPVPVFLGLNFKGNHAIHRDRGISLADCWLRNDPEHGVTEHRATEQSRGAAASRWPVEKILARGYGLATVCYTDIAPDDGNEFTKGVHRLFFKPGQTRPEPAEWGAIGAWAWGLSRALDYLETDQEVDAKHVAVLGHSRLGKTSLWAGAQDERFALVISNDSGRGGASITRRQFGEPVGFIATVVGYWFCGNYRQFIDCVDVLPVDQHMLIALMAPRPVYIASAVEDTWADPHGEFLSGKNADPVFRLLGTDGLPVQENPPVDKPVLNGTIGYHVRHGDHDVTDYDWQCFMDFADRHFHR
jgi:hypothetical protein